MLIKNIAVTLRERGLETIFNNSISSRLPKWILSKIIGLKY